MSFDYGTLCHAQFVSQILVTLNEKYFLEEGIKMATPSKRRKYLYEADDLVDEFLFNVVTKHVNIENISLFGLKFGEDLPTDPFAVEEKTKRVSNNLNK